jgi:SAM-dependent methyltransferase
MDRQLLDELALAARSPIVDVGCGPGQVGAYLKQHDRAVLGADISKEMASLAARRLDGALVADLRALPLAEHSAGAVVAFYSVIHLPRNDLDLAFAEFARVLCPDGHLLVSVHEGEGENTISEFLGEPVSLSATFFTLDELTRAAEAAGLAVRTAQRRSPYPSEVQTTRLYLTATRPSTVC